MALVAINWSAPLSSLAGTVTIGQCLVDDGGSSSPSGQYVVATSANRGTKRSSGIAITAGDSKNPVAMFVKGELAPAITGLPPGVASPLRVSASGALERVTTPTSSDDVVGYCEANGLAHVDFGPLTHRLYVDGVGSSSDTQVLFNDGGAVAGNAAFKFNKTTGAITAVPASGTPGYAFGYGSSANSGAIAAGWQAVAGNFYTVALGKDVNANGAGAIAIGEVITSSAANGIGIGYSITNSGLYAGGIGVSLTLAADYSFATGVVASTRQAGERTHGYNLTGCQPEKVWGGGGTGAGAAVNLTGAGGAEFVAAQGAIHEMLIHISGVKTAGAAYGRAVYRATAVYPSGGGLSVVDVTSVEKTGAFFSAAWGVTIAASGTNVRININPGADTVKFGCRVTWIETSIP